MSRAACVRGNANAMKNIYRTHSIILDHYTILPTQNVREYEIRIQSAVAIGIYKRTLRHILRHITRQISQGRFSTRVGKFSASSTCWRATYGSSKNHADGALGTLWTRYLVCAMYTSHTNAVWLLSGVFIRNTPVCRMRVCRGHTLRIASRSASHIRRRQFRGIRNFFTTTWTAVPVYILVAHVEHAYQFNFLYYWLWRSYRKWIHSYALRRVVDKQQ